MPVLLFTFERLWATMQTKSSLSSNSPKRAQCRLQVATKRARCTSSIAQIKYGCGGGADPRVPFFGSILNAVCILFIWWSTLAPINLFDGQSSLYYLKTERNQDSYLHGAQVDRSYYVGRSNHPTAWVGSQIKAFPLDRYLAGRCSIPATPTHLYFILVREYSAGIAGSIGPSPRGPDLDPLICRTWCMHIFNSSIQQRTGNSFDHPLIRPCNARFLAGIWYMPAGRQRSPDRSTPSVFKFLSLF